MTRSRSIRRVRSDRSAAARQRRRALFETLEDRRVLAAVWRNAVDSLDVNQDQFVVPLDALEVINELNSVGPHVLPAAKDPAAKFLDTSGDQFVSPVDALLVINYLNDGAGQQRRLLETGSLASSTEITIGLGQDAGSRTYRVQIDSTFDTTDQTPALEDLLAVYLVDEQDPTTTILDRGTPGTALFTLAGTDAEYVPGGVRWDGSVLEIDLTAFAARTAGVLKFQLLSSDTDNATQIKIKPLSNDVDLAGVARPSFAASSPPTSAGGALALAGLTPPSQVDVSVGNVRFDSTTGRYAAELELRNQGTDLGSRMAVAFPGLPASVTLLNPSGFLAGGVPYLNVQGAVGTGGLRSGDSSAPVRIEFNDPSQTRFSITPTILAGTNHAPTLAPIGPLTTSPGGVLRVPLVATDSEGDTITFALRGATNLPNSTLRANGMLEFRPAPGQLGNYSFEVVASDGALETTRTVSLNVVADPLTTTRVSGQVLKVDGTPLEHVTVEIGGVQGLTAADGSFLLDLGSGPVVSDTVKVRGDLFAGPPALPFIAEKLAFVLTHDLYPAVNNVIDRPLYLPTLDLANGKSIDPLHDTMVTTAAIPGVSVFVAAGTLMNQQGSPFTGVLSVTEVPVNLTPAALPGNLRPDLVVTIQPGDMVFATPAPLSFPNRGGWAPGTKMDLWSINPVTGQFDDVGDMQVSADGATIDTISGGVRNSSWHFPAPPPPTPPPPTDDPSNPDDDCDECKLSAPANSIVELHSGAEIESHSLASYMSQGVSHNWTLTYDSLRADPQPIVHFGFNNTQPFSNLKLVASMSITRGDYTFEVPGYDGGAYGLQTGDHIWSISPDEPDAKVALQADLRNAPSGRYQANITQGLRQFDGQSFTGTSVTTELNILHVNTISSQFGAGWGLNGLQELVENPDGSVLLIDGDGGESLYGAPAGAGQPYVSPPGTFSTLVRQPDQTFRLTTTDKMVDAFNSLNKLASVTDRNGNTTAFAYDGQGRLVKITDPVGLETIFLIGANGKVSQITDPAGRVTQINYDAAGNLTKVTDPDSAARTWQYDADHHMTGEIDQLGREEHSTYDFAGRVQQAVLKDGTVRQFQPLQVRNLLPLDASINPLAPPVAHASGAATASFADGNGNVTVNVLDRAGQVVSSFDGEGQLPTVARNNQNEIVQSIDGRGHITLYEYDARGNVIKSRDENSGGNATIGAISAAGERDVYTFTGSVGQRIYYDALPSNGDDLRVQLFSPTGQSLFFNNDDSDNGPYTLGEDGEFRLELFGNGAAIGDYAFSLYTPSTTLAPLPLGQEVSGEIRVPGELDIFTFTGSVGQRLFYDGLSSNSDDLRVQLVGPTGQQLFFNHDELDNGPYTLNEAGVYRLNLYGANEAVGDYHFRMVEPTVTVAPLALGSDVSGTIDLPGDLDVFTFTGSVGQRLYYDGLASANDDLRVDLIGPSGQSLFFNHDEANNGPYTLSEAGPYRLNLYGANDAVGDYHFRVVEPTVTTAPLVLGVDVSGTLDLPGDVDSYTFTGSVGQRLFYDGLTSASDDLRAELISPTGQSLFFNHDETNNGPYTLSETGPYRLNLYGGADAVGDYHFRVVEPTVTTTTLVLGAEVSGTIDLPGDLDVFTFTGSVGQQLYYDGLSSNDDDLRAQLISPTGQSLFFNHDETNNGPYTLSEGGLYRLNLYGSSDAIGDYHFRLLDLSSNPLVIGSPVAGNLSPGSSVSAFRFTGTLGQRLTFDGQQTGNANWLLLGPADQVIGGNVGIGTDFTVVLPSTGPYSLLLSGSDAVNPVPFSFQVNDVSDAPVAPTGFDVPHSGAIAAGQQAQFTFDAPAGLAVLFDSTATTNFTSLQAELRDPLNQQVFFTNDFAQQGPLVLARAGTYTLTITGDTAASTGNYAFTLRDLIHGATSIGFDAPQTDVLGSFESKTFTFAASVGQHFFYDSLESDFDNVSVVVTTPSGSVMFNQNSDYNQGPYTLTEAGDYSLVIHNNSTATPDFNFRVLSPSFTSTAMSFGATNSDQLAAPGDRKEYTFTGSVGQRIFYDSLQSDFAISTRAQLLTPSGVALFNTNTDYNQGPFTLTEAGTYRILVSGDNDATGTYSFRVVEPTFSSQSLAIGAVVSDQLAGPGDRKEYTLTGSIGQRIFYDSLQSDFSIATRAQLFAPNGDVVFNSNTDYNEGPYTLTEAGTYRLLISGDNDVTGTYSFRIVQPSFDSQALTLGGVVSAQLASPGDRKEYTFAGSVGQRIFYDSLQNDFSISTRAQLFAPSGVAVFNSNTDNNNGPFTLTESGAYHLLVSGDNDTTGTYSFRVIQPTFDSQPLVIGAVVNSQLVGPGDRKEYTFAANVGERLFYDSLQNDFTGGMRAQLIAPSGVTVFNSNTDNNNGPFTLTESGAYHLLVSGDNDVTGTFGFQMFEAGLAPMIALDTTVNGTLATGLGAAFYQLNGTAGQHLFFDALQAANLNWTLYGPGNEIVVNGGFSDLETTLAKDSVYLLELSNNATNAATPYQFRVVTPETTTTPLTLGAVTAGTISEPGEQDVFTFTGGIGQKFFYDSQQNDFASINFSLVSPSGAVTQARNTDDENNPLFALLETGIYRVVVDAVGDVTGSYQFRLLNTLAAPTVTLGVPASGTLTPGLAADVYRLEGTSGQRLRFDFTATNGYSWDLVSSGGFCVLCGQSPGTNILATLPGAGTYTMSIRGTNAAVPHAYGFTITDVSDAPVATSGLPLAQSGSLTPLQELTFNFTASAGVKLFFDSLDADNDSAVVELRDPANGQVFFQSASSDAGPLTLPRSGVYALKVRNSSGSAAADYNFRLLNLADSPTVLVNSTITDSLAVPFETDLFAFNATAGQRLYFDTRASNLGTIRQRVLGPDSQTLFDVTTDIGAGPFTITQSGRYTLLIGGTETTAGNYSVRLVDVLAAPQLEFATLVTDAITLGVEADTYHFTGLENQTVDVVTTSPAFNARGYLYGGGNQLLATIVIGQSQTVTLPRAGDYVLVVDGNATFTQSYTLRITVPTTQTIPLTPRTLPSTAPGQQTFTYDATFNQLTSTTDELGRQTLYGIDPSNGNTLSVTQVIGTVGGGDDLVTSFTYTSHGLVHTMTDPLGRVTEYVYDALDRLTQTTEAFGTPDQGVTHYEYDAAGNATAAVDENGHRTEYQYDALNRLTRLTAADPDGAGPLASPVTQYVYDARGNQTQLTDARNNLWRYQFDARDRLVTSIDPANATTTFAYDQAGNLIVQTDSLSHVTRYEYDSRNRLVRTLDPDAGETQFSYDADNHVASVTDPVGNETRYEYDARGRVVRRTDPLSNPVDYEWSAVDTLSAMTDRLSRRTEYAYDDVNRRTSETWIGGDNSIEYAYDKASNLLSATDSFSGLTMTYDARDRVGTVDNTGTPSVPAVVLTYAYDPAGNRLSTADTIGGAAGGVNSYSYDGLDRVTRITQSGTNVSDKRVDLGYNSLGQFSSIQRFHDLAGTQLVVGTNYAYDSLNRLTGLHHRNAANSDVSFFDFVYDSHSRITRITDVDGATNYTYDARDELTAADHAAPGNPDESYSYDANGNRVTSSRHGAGYVTGSDNRLLSDGTYNYTYDLEGNLVRRTEIATGKYREFQWDYRNRLIAVIDKTAANGETQRVEFTYDALNRRISKGVDTTPLDAVDAALTHFVYDGGDVLLDFVDADGSGPLAANLAQRYLHGSAVDQVLAQDNGAGSVLWQLSDQVGTVRDLADSNGTVANHLTYDSYGNVIAETNSAIDTRYQFTGREFDGEIGLQYSRARYYDPALGRFLSLDPIGFAGGQANLYDYVANRPTSATDPSGLDCESDKKKKDEEDKKKKDEQAEADRRKKALDDIAKIRDAYPQNDKLSDKERNERNQKLDDIKNKQLNNPQPWEAYWPNQDPAKKDAASWNGDTQGAIEQWKANGIWMQGNGFGALNGAAGK